VRITVVSKWSVFTQLTTMEGGGGECVEVTLSLLMCDREVHHRVLFSGEMKLVECICLLSWSLHCNFVRDVTRVKGSARTPPSLSSQG
jgi:hypothetical protein